jgi:hypothetical protein
MRWANERAGIEAIGLATERCRGRLVWLRLHDPLASFFFEPRICMGPSIFHK